MFNLKGLTLSQGNTWPQLASAPTSRARSESFATAWSHRGPYSDRLFDRPLSQQGPSRLPFCATKTSPVSAESAHSHAEGPPSPTPSTSQR
ncbi:hypothetical protein CCHR01_00492 [Colletotrichum chrysophilum]|uniref:Uncharacterized protein n=1 Tax=Colletotrichum chrysophilum TaxID=1836956 RepID=A0AAD9B236_9PEZI|nr:hypothetical protein CCHR01_00492 [Colletotrichum chrysophilum]